MRLSQTVVYGLRDGPDERIVSLELFLRPGVFFDRRL